MKIKITYHDGGVCPVVRELENVENLEIIYDSNYVKIQKPGTMACVFLLNASRFISAERIE